MSCWVPRVVLCVCCLVTILPTAGAAPVGSVSDGPQDEGRQEPPAGETGAPNRPAQGDLLTALLGAVVGGLLTLSGDLLLRNHFDKKRLVEMLESVRRDLEAISASLAKKPEAGPAFEFRPEFPTQSWQLLVASGLLGRVPGDLRKSLDATFRGVNSANYVYRMVPDWLQLSASLHGDPALGNRFRAIAKAAASFPYDHLKPQVQESLGIFKSH